VDGFLNVLKPKGVTSHDVVMIARRSLREDRLGHLGTLDPLAVGVLPLACGTYRRLSEYFLGEDKRYFAEFTFGVRTDTGDTDGDVVEERDASRLTPDDVRRALHGFTGTIMQRPPSYSALKVGGRKLMDLAREGALVEPEPREVVIHELSLSGWMPGAKPKGLFSMRVGRGTYVRSLAFSLGDIVGCGATVSYLLRSRVGKFRLKDAVTVPELRKLGASRRAQEAIVPPLSVMPGYPVFVLRPGADDKVSHGVAIGMADVRPADGSDERQMALPDRKVSTIPFGVTPLTDVRYKTGESYRAIVAMPDGREIAAVVSVQDDGHLKYEKVMISKG